MKKFSSTFAAFFRRICILFCASFAHSAFAQPTTEELKTPASQLRGIIERYQVDYAILNRYYNIADSPTRAERVQQFYSGWLSTLNKINFNGLNQDDQIDYLLFQNYLSHSQRQTEIKAKAFAEIAPLVPFAQDIFALEESRQRMENIDAAKTATALNQLSKKIGELQKSAEANLKNETTSRTKKTVANRAVMTTENLRNVLKRWFGFYNGYDPTFSWWNESPYKTLDQALQNYGGFLREKVVGLKPTDENAIVGNPIGREALLSELAYEMIPYTPEELIALANQEFAWCDSEMKKAAQELGYDDWHKALEYVKTLHVEPGKQPAMIRELALEAIKFVEDRDLVTVPPLAKESWRMEMMTPERQLVNPFFLGGETIIVSYPTNTMTHEQKLMSMRGNNRHFARATVHHELVPGHHLQLFMAARHKPYRELFRTPFLVEGWSLYWEFLLWDLSFPQTPENKIGMLFWRMHRCARIIFSLSFHLEKMTPQECVDFLVNRVGHEYNNAEAEVRRSFAGDYGPLYQAAYMLGGLQLRGLHKELVASGKMTNRAFHDAVLRENAIPVELIRASLTKQKLTRDFASRWKFYDGNLGK